MPRWDWPREPWLAYSPTGCPSCLFEQRSSAHMVAADGDCFPMPRRMPDSHERPAEANHSLRDRPAQWRRKMKERILVAGAVLLGLSASGTMPVNATPGVCSAVKPRDSHWATIYVPE